MNIETAIFLLDDIKIYIPLEPDTYKYEEAIDMAISTLKKSIPKKPIVEVGYRYCPTCGEVVLSTIEQIKNEYNHDHCGGCGQRIDWGEKE